MKAVSRFLFSEEALEEIRRRLIVHAVIIFCVWPLFSAVMAATEIRKIPYFLVPWPAALGGAFAGILILIPDFLVIGTFSMLTSIVIFSILASKKLLKARGWLTAEPSVLFLSILFGSALHYPSVLSQPSLALLHSLPTWIATTLLGALILFSGLLLAAPGSRLRVLTAIMVIGLIIPVPVAIHLPKNIQSGEAPLVLLGLDSLSHDDNLTLLKTWTEKNSGTWYSRPVTPGLLTNSVWTSLITMRPVHDHGVFHTFQPFPKLREIKTLIELAKQAGYRTVSVFPDQQTCWVGTQAGFDDDRSGPVGWRQLATSYVENASILLPLVRPLLPKLPFSAVPPNHLGTFTYNLDRELNEIFAMSSPGARTFVAAHLTYLHTPRFPQYAELSWQERLQVLGAEVRSVRDRSFDWQDIDLPTDPIPLNEWKEQRLQQAVVNSIETTKFLERKGRLFLFSDHGDRHGMTLDNFWEERYHRVLLLTFGLPTRDLEAPISLLDASSLLGLATESPAFDPIVEYMNSQSFEWSILMKSARPRWDGSVELDERLLRVIFRGLRSYRPWASQIPTRIDHVFDAVEIRP